MVIYTKILTVPDVYTDNEDEAFGVAEDYFMNLKIDGLTYIDHVDDKMYSCNKVDVLSFDVDF